MKTIEPIIRLVMHQLTEVLPVNVLAAAPEQSADETILPLKVPAQVQNSYKALRRDAFPALVIIPGQSAPTIPEQQLDSGDFDCQVWRHDFAVYLAYTASEATAKENLTYIVARMIELIQDTITDFTEEARTAAYLAARQPDTDTRIVVGPHYHEEDDKASFLLQTAMMEFTAYC